MYKNIKILSLAILLDIELKKPNNNKQNNLKIIQNLDKNLEKKNYVDVLRYYFWLNNI